MYEKRIVVFLDMMGFKEMLDKPDDLQSAITDLKTIMKPTDGESNDFIHFSDSVVIASKPATYQDATSFLFLLMYRLCVLIAVRKIPVRGAVVYGNYSYRDGILISPAVADAYALESKFARYPRVVIGKSLIDFLMSAPGSTNSFASEMDLNFMSDLDQDGFRFLNYLHASSIERRRDGLEYDSETAMQKHLESHRWFIENAIAGTNDESIREKYIWMGNFHNRFVTTDRKVPDKSRKSLKINKDLLQLNR